MAGAFDEIGTSISVVGATFLAILGDSQSAKYYLFIFFPIKKCVSKMGRVRSPKRRVRNDKLWSDCRRIIFILVEII